MAVSGLSQGREIQGESSQLPTNASNIVMAALEMQEWITTSMPDLPMRIGIHSGDVVAGVI
jgi:class 3 adenylate cyclase